MGQAQAATVYQYCQDFYGCDPDFVAEAGERNNVRVTQVDPYPRASVRFEDSGAFGQHLLAHRLRKRDPASALTCAAGTPDAPANVA